MRLCIKENPMEVPREETMEEISWVDWEWLGMVAWRIWFGWWTDWKRWLEQAFQCQVESWCKGNFQDSTRMTPVKSPSNSKYLVWTGHFLCSEKTPSGRTRTPTQLHNLWPLASPACVLSGGKGALENREVSNQGLVQSQTYTRNKRRRPRDLG